MLVQTRGTGTDCRCWYRLEVLVQTVGVGTGTDCTCWYILEVLVQTVRVGTY